MKTSTPTTKRQNKYVISQIFSEWRSLLMNASTTNQLCVSAKMEEQLPSMDILNCPPKLSNGFKELRCNYCSVAVEVSIKLRSLYDGSYQFFKQKQISRKTILN